MDDLLPSYESAVQRDPWRLVAPYLRSNDLCSAAVVCRKWHATFTPKLWGNPASHFGVENDTVYVALTRFKRTLPFVRPFVSELTHTLHFPPAHAELYDGPHAEWLRDCLEYLPRLQCLMVDGLPFFDHASLLSLRYASQRWKPNNPNAFPVFALRLLDASSCKNATPKGLTEALPHFPDLVSLDLSGTIGARNAEVLGALNRLFNLRVLNLKNLGLKDIDFSVIARAIKTRVRSLDVSGNQLTDVSVRLLLEHCIKKVNGEESNIRYHAQTEEQRIEWPIDAQGNVSLVGHLRSRLTEGFVGRLAIEQTGDHGITHLFLSRNPITVECISSLLHTERLQVLDIGLLPVVADTQDPSLNGIIANKAEPTGVSKLIPIISKHASANLQYLRINYQIITKDAPPEEPSSPRAELSAESNIHDPSGTQELDATEPPLAELEPTDTAVFEVTGDSSFPAELPASFPDDASSTSPVNEHDVTSPTTSLLRTPAVEVTLEPAEVKQDAAAFAPEVVPTNSSSEETSLSSGTRDEWNNTTRASNNRRSTLSPISPHFDGESMNLLVDQVTAPSPSRSTHYVEDRRAHLDLRQSQENCLHPGNLARLHTLVLTGVPESTTNRKVVDRLIQYIIDAGEETAIATQRARHTYILPPGRSRAIAEREYVRHLFALRRIVLEIAPPPVSPKKISTSWRTSPTKSSTEDADSEMFWQAAQHDFSFFSDDEECGLPTREPGRTLPLAAMSGLEVAETSGSVIPIAPPVAPMKLEPVFDVVQEIGKFRRDRKAAYENLVRMGDLEPDVPGYWAGDITVLRVPVDAGAGELDCYGNRFESGWFYR